MTTELAEPRLVVHAEPTGIDAFDGLQRDAVNATRRRSLNDACIVAPHWPGRLDDRRARPGVFDQFEKLLIERLGRDSPGPWGHHRSLVVNEGVAA